ncbi:MAG: CDP-alcohol phosphatidyltransferase family protein [Candidatus Mariimomonas ferrooxydans]
MSTFNGDKKAGESILGRLEKKLVNTYVSRIPKGIETYHLTAMTVLWSLGMVFFGYLADKDLFWIWGMSGMLVFQYLTDLFDGAVGRHRNTGLVKWGFYMDHFLDFIFSSSIVIAYALIASPGLEFYFLCLLVCSGAFMVNSFLSFASTNEFTIAYYGLGPTEIRLGYIILNTIIFFFGAGIFTILIPILLTGAILTLIFLVYKSQKRLWIMDMKEKS